MKFEIVDRRKNPKDKSLVNRQRFLRRHAREMEEAVREKIRQTEIGDIASDKPKRLRISTRATEQPVFRHGKGGVVERVLPGNKEFRAGDTLPRPPAGGGGGGAQGSDGGEGEDDFVFEVSQEEFLHYFFEGLELPEMAKKVLAGEEVCALRRAGFSVEGTPSNLDPIRTLRRSQARRIAFRMPKLRRKHRLEEEGALLEQQLARGGDAVAPARKRLEEIAAEIEKLERQLKAIPFIDDVDIRYRRFERLPVPIAQAVMFCILDVSGSMGAVEKEMAKRFFMLLYLFLRRNYARVEVVFIRHHHTAKEVDEEEFFRSRESGGTIVSSALELMRQIAAERYPSSRWNIYGCQASDGDNLARDLPLSYALMAESIMPLVQYYAYVEIGGRNDSELWSTYRALEDIHPHFAMARIATSGDIYPVFRGLFATRKEGVAHG